MQQYLITYQEPDAPVHTGFMKAIQEWKRITRGQIVLLSKGIRKPLTDRLVALDAKIPPQQKNPLTGVQVLSKGSMIVASPKQALRVVATGNSSEHTPRQLISTGACTKPEYNDNRIGQIAEQEHVIGGVVVDLFPGGGFSIRHVQAAKDGSFVDLGRRFSKNGVTHVQATTITLGDMHVDSIDEDVLSEWIKLIKKLKPHSVFLHDLSDSASCNPHAGMTEAAGRPTVEYEWLDIAHFLGRFTRTLPKETSVKVVASNHDSMLDRYLDSKDWTKDPANIRFCAELLFLKMQADSQTVLPLLHSWLDKDVSNRIQFLSRKDTVIFDGVTYSNHGDVGAKGSRGSLGQFVKLGQGFDIGHSHSPAIEGNVFQAGCSCRLDAAYTKGPHDWMHASIVRYGKNWRQMIILGGR